MVEQEKRVFDPCIRRIVNLLERCNFSLRPSQSRWQFGILLVTIDFLGLSTGLAFCAMHLSISEVMQMTSWFLIIGVAFIGLSVLGLVFIWMLADYFRRNPTEEHISTTMEHAKRELGEKLDELPRKISENLSVILAKEIVKAYQKLRELENNERGKSKKG